MFKVEIYKAVLFLHPVLVRLSGERWWSHPSAPPVSINISLINLTSTAVNVKWSSQKLAAISSTLFYLTVATWEPAERVIQSYNTVEIYRFGRLILRSMNWLVECAHICFLQRDGGVLTPSRSVNPGTLVKRAFLLSSCSRGQQVRPCNWLVWSCASSIS